jgi:eukaryotic-like serine/threonine-protein kinase
VDIPGVSITTKLTEGGCAEIFAGVDQSSGKLVVVKVLHTRHLGNKAEHKRMVEEGAIGLKLPAHDNIVKTLKAGVVDKRPYVVLEYLKGPTLRELIVAKRTFTDVELLKMTKHLARALKHLHDNNIAHKDLKPDNIIIAEDGKIKLLDFGFASYIKAFSFFAPTSVDGSPAYMAPEIFTTRKGTAATDIYALGCTLYEAATGTPPFSAMSSSQVIGLQMDMSQSANSISVKNKKISPLTERLILTACQKSVNQRFKSVDEILLELARNPGTKGHRDSFRMAASTIA